jgi:hypothetical protein
MRAPRRHRHLTRMPGESAKEYERLARAWDEQASLTTDKATASAMREMAAKYRLLAAAARRVRSE